MSLFDKEFYPTPQAIIHKMTAPYAQSLATRTVLEPSAGNGAILDALSSGVPYDFENKRGEKIRLEGKASRIYCIEKDPELRLILQQKGYRVISDDFLTFTPEHRFDLILMNPPFSHGAEHLLHAWEILRSGDIACLLNAETLRNPCTAKRRQLAAIIAEHGSVEELGRCFAGSDHDTDVEVALVRLHKEAAGESEFTVDFGGFEQEKTPNFADLSASGNQVAVSNALDAYLRSYQMTKLCAVDFIKSFRRFAFYAKTFLNGDMSHYDQFDNSGSIFTAIIKDLGEDATEHGCAIAYDNFLDYIKDKAWRQIISQIGLDKYMTSTMQQTMQDFRDAQGSMELNKANIMALFQMLMGNLGNIMNRCVSDVYDLFTSYYKGNTSCEEGWKTNKRYKANRKVIIPNCADAGFMPQRYGYEEFFRTSIYRSLSDIDKAMCWLTGQNYEKLDNNPCRSFTGPSAEQASRMTISAAIESIRVGDQNWHDSAFFRVKAFKKGTVHIEFKDEALWTKFNVTVNKEKNLIGDDLS